MSNKKRALGRGLNALLENNDTDITSRQVGEESQRVAGSVSLLPVEFIEANPFQPRSHFSAEALSELSESILTHGIIQPVTVRKMGYDNYQLISGERRFRAAQLAGLSEIPAYIRIANDQTMLEMALVENIQRENLDAIEIAISFTRLIEECSLTQEALSEKVSKKRSTVTNYLRLLKLPAEIQLGIREQKIKMGHARAIINVEDKNLQLNIYQNIIDHDLSVRQVEELIRDNYKTGIKTQRKNNSQLTSLTGIHQKLREELSANLGSSVELKRNHTGKGKIIIPFNSDQDLERIIELLNS